MVYYFIPNISCVFCPSPANLPNSHTNGPVHLYFPWRFSNSTPLRHTSFYLSTGKWQLGHCIRAPFNISQQILVASCKTVYLETFCWWPPMFNWGPAAGDEFSKPLSLVNSTWAQHSWTALATQISLFSRSLCLFFFTLIPEWLSHCDVQVKGKRKWQSQLRMRI